MGKDRASRSPLKPTAVFEDSDTECETLTGRPYQHRKRRSWWQIGFIISLLLINNLIWVIWSVRSNARSSQPEDIHVGTELQDANYPPREKIIVPFRQYTEFNGEHSSADRNTTNDLWRGLFPNGSGVVSIPRDEARERNLPSTLSDPKDPNSDIYLLAGFHHLHCLTVIRSSIWHFKFGEEQTIPWDHVTHCMDAVRQSLMCNMDTTLLWTANYNVFGDGQSHICTNYWGLNDWLAEHSAEGADN